MTRTIRIITGGMCAVAVIAVVAARPASQAAQSSPTVTKDVYDRWVKGEQTSLPSNWGRWGKDDEIGAINLITPAKRKEAAALVKEGFSVSLARDAETEKALDNPSPYEHVMQGIGSDRIAVAYHGQSHTHIDSLAHHFDFGGAGYNGYRPDEAFIKKLGGHPKNSIYNLKNGIFTRGILIDIARLRGVPYLEAGTPIYIKDLEAFEKMAGIKVSPGDALFVRTGMWVQRKVTGPWERGMKGKSAGLDPSVMPWLRQRDVALLGMDGVQYVSPSDMPAAVHNFAMVALGVHLFDNCDLEALAEAAAARKRWEFLLTVAPLPIRGGTGSPVNPIATF